MEWGGDMASPSWTCGRRVAPYPRPWMGALDGRARNALKRKARDLGKKRETMVGGLALTNYYKLVVAAGELTISVLDSVVHSEAEINANIATMVREKVVFPLAHRLALVRRAARSQMDRCGWEAVVGIANPLAENAEFNPLAPRLCDCGATTKQQVATMEAVLAKQALVVFVSEGERKKGEVSGLAQAIIGAFANVDLLEAESSIVTAVTEAVEGARALMVLCDFNALPVELGW